MTKLVIPEYLKKLPESQKSELTKIYELVKQYAPEAAEGFYYGVPGFKVNGKYLLGFAALKNHLSLFPSSEPIEKFAEELVGFKISKGTIQFSDTNPLPEKLITDIIIFRLKCLQK